jgi:hypothetical protein
MQCQSAWAKCWYWCMRRKRGVLKRRISLRRTLLDVGRKSTVRPRPKETTMHDTNIVIVPPSGSTPRPFVSSWDLTEDDAGFPPKVLSFQADYARRNSISLPCSPSPKNLHPSSVSIHYVCTSVVHATVIMAFLWPEADVLLILFCPLVSPLLSLMHWWDGLIFDLCFNLRKSRITVVGVVPVAEWIMPSYKT